MSRRSLSTRMDRISKWLIAAVLLFFVILLLAQLVLQVHMIREWVTGVDRLEGIPFS
ncbi:hypothetical protein AB6A23_15360 [Paenibacillus tarimensis]